ncbi:MAG TPA: glycosyltransferase family 39 protein [Verrucomicrobiae bacterium]|nr:glycosyltransferase family 39 protein [Verrucomicrobiae bacterium]
MSKGARWAIGTMVVLVALVHLSVAGKYDLFRNELYFIVCGRHPAFGYVDQPPLVPLLAALMQIGGVNVWLERLPAVLTAIAIVPLTVIFAQLLGASARGAWLAAVAAASSTLVTAMFSWLSTGTFEPFDFTLVAYLITRGFLRNEPRMYWWAGLVGGLAFETKYTILLWIIGLALGIALFGPRSIFRSRDLWVGVAIAAVIALPNAIWQAAHGFPFLELVRNDNSGNLIGRPIGFVLQQAFIANLLLAPLWLAGIIVPFVAKRLAPFRFLAVTFVTTIVLIYVTHGKAYYSAGAYPTIFALGAAACTMLPRVLVGIWAVLAYANAVLALPFVLPILPPERLKVMYSRSPMRPMERAGIGAPIPQNLADEFGWRDVARSVENVYASLPPADRAKAAIFGSNYGEAAAVDVYGHDLPPAISGNNNYYLWGPRGYDGSVVIAINVDPAQWATFCDSARVVAYFGDSPYAMPYEVHRPIVLCRGMRPPLPQLWPQFKHYGIENLGTTP